MHEFAKPLSPNKCIMIGMYFSATNKATTDETLKVGKEFTRVVRDCLWETYHANYQGMKTELIKPYLQMIMMEVKVYTTQMCCRTK